VISDFTVDDSAIDFMLKEDENDDGSASSKQHMIRMTGDQNSSLALDAQSGSEDADSRS